MSENLSLAVENIYKHTHYLLGDEASTEGVGEKEPPNMFPEEGT